MAIYAALPIVAALLSMFFIPVFCFFRYCCCCARGCSTCGKKYPNASCCCFIPGPTKLTDEEGNTRMYYSRCQRVSAFFCMTLFLILVGCVRAAAAAAAPPSVR